MPRKIVISPFDQEALAELVERFNHTPDAETHLRYQMVLLAQQGLQPQEIAPIVLRSHDTVTRVLRRYLRAGLDAVPRRKGPGRARTVTPAWEAELLRVIELDPHEVGVSSANWTTGLLAAHPGRRTLIQISQHPCVIVSAKTWSPCYEMRRRISVISREPGPGPGPYG